MKREQKCFEGTRAGFEVEASRGREGLPAPAGFEGTRAVSRWKSSSVASSSYPKGCVSTWMRCDERVVTFGGDCRTRHH